MSDIWVYTSDLENPDLVRVQDTVVPAEEWVTDHGFANYPEAIYFFAELTTEAY